MLIYLGSCDLTCRAGAREKQVSLRSQASTDRHKDTNACQYRGCRVRKQSSNPMITLQVAENVLCLQRHNVDKGFAGPHACTATASVRCSVCMSDSTMRMMTARVHETRLLRRPKVTIVLSDYSGLTSGTDALRGSRNETQATQATSQITTYMS